MVQRTGLEMLMRQDNIERQKSRIESFGLAVVASGVRSISEVFPDEFPAPAVPTSSTDQDLPDDALDEVGTRFDYSQTELDMQAAQAEIEALQSSMGDDQVSARGDGDGWI